MVVLPEYAVPFSFLFWKIPFSFLYFYYVSLFPHKSRKDSGQFSSLYVGFIYYYFSSLFFLSLFYSFLFLYVCSPTQHLLNQWKLKKRSTRQHVWLDKAVSGLHLVIQSQILPENEYEAKWLISRVKAYTLIDAELYKRSTFGFLQCYISPKEGRKVYQQIHSGICGHHVLARSMVGKAFRGF